MSKTLKSTHSDLQLHVYPSSSARGDLHLWFRMLGEGPQGQYVDGSMHVNIKDAVQMAIEILRIYGGGDGQ